MSASGTQSGGRLDIEAIRVAHPLSSIAGARLKLIRCGTEWKACCPFHDEQSPSFTIFAGDRRFHCFGCGASGDVLDYVQHLHGVALREAAAMICGGSLPTIEIAPITSPEKSDRGDEARAIWRQAEPAPGTLVEDYLRSRGLHLRIPETLRFARLRYGKRGREHPCLVAAVSSVDRKFMGIQRTYLAPGGTAKANVPKPKLSLGRVSGGAIRLTPASEHLTVCEGLEDGLTLQQERGCAVWVAAGASMLPSMRFPSIVRSVAIGGDADDAGRAAAAKAAEAFASRGLEARVFFPGTGKDFNDELTGAFA